MSSNSKRRGQTPAQRAAAERRAAAASARRTPTVPSNETSSTTPSGPPLHDGPQADDGIFDLDAVVHEAAGERFRFKTGSGPDRRIWWLKTPEEVDWRENSTLSERATGLEDMRPVLELLLGEEQYEDFLDQSISMGKVSALLEAWREWHGIELPESHASRR